MCVCGDGGVLTQTSKHLLGEVEKSPWDEKQKRCTNVTVSVLCINDLTSEAGEMSNISFNTKLLRNVVKSNLAK